MEFNEKLQELRKHKGLTREELAESLYVSRAAISKWESGRGYPSIDSLKAIAKYYGVTVDELLSGDEVLTIAETEQKQTETYFRDLVFGLLDFSTAVFFFLPLFGQKAEGVVQEVSLLSLTTSPPYLRAAYFAIVIGMILLGLLTIVLQNFSGRFWTRSKRILSLSCNAVGVLLFIVSLQPYAAVFLFVFLTIKALLLIKKQ